MVRGALGRREGSGVTEYRYPAQTLRRCVRIGDEWVPVRNLALWKDKHIYLLPDGTRGECGPEEWFWQAVRV